MLTAMRNLVVPHGRLTVVTGPNGGGKSCLYPALRLFAEAAGGGLVGALAQESELPSTLWAGPETIARSARAGVHAVEGTLDPEIKR